MEEEDETLLLSGRRMEQIKSRRRRMNSKFGRISTKCSLTGSDIKTFTSRKEGSLSKSFDYYHDDHRGGMGGSSLSILNCKKDYGRMGKLELKRKNGVSRLSRKLEFYHFSWIFLLFLLILSEQGTFQQKNNGGVGGSNDNNGSTRTRWQQHQTALSNTGPLGESGESVAANNNFINGSAIGTLSISTTIQTSTTPSTTTNTLKSTPKVNTTATTLGITRHQHQQTRSVTSSKSVNINSGIVSSYNNNRNNGKNLLNSGSGGRKWNYEDQHKFTDGAMFENNTSVNITVPLGDTAFLRCRVKNLGERSISWIRRRDWHILTTGKTTYTNDERFHVLHTEGTDDWTLQIKFVQQRDNGTYECQISTGTGIISFMVNLMIAVPEAFILGNGDEYHVEQGSTINLVCVIEKSPKVPEYIFWYHYDRMINYMTGSSREVTVKIEPGARTQSRLQIRGALISDSGNYTCQTKNALPTWIFVYVSQASGLFSGDKIAAIQRRKSSSGSSSSTSSAPSTGHLPYYISSRKKTHLETYSSSSITLFVHWLTTKMTRMRETFPLFLYISQSLVTSWTFSILLSTPEFLFSLGRISTRLLFK